MSNIIRIPEAQMHNEFKRILLKHQFEEEKAEKCAGIFTNNSLDGVYSHGVNRFPRFVQYIADGHINISAEPKKIHQNNGMEQWDGQLGPGPLNATLCTERVCELADEFGIACVSLARTNHWMRGGAYAWEAAKKGYVFIAWTNTMPNMPTWGSKENRLGNNPLVLATPYKDSAIVLDMAMSQYSYGTIENYDLNNKELPLPGGYDEQGKLTCNPAQILKTQRPLPVGYWKGAGLSLLLDILSVALSGGLATHQVGQEDAEIGVSQIFIAINTKKLAHANSVSTLVENIVDDYMASETDQSGGSIRYPGERVIKDRKENGLNGIPVEKSVWETIQNL